MRLTLAVSAGRDDKRESACRTPHAARQTEAAVSNRASWSCSSSKSSSTRPAASGGAVTGDGEASASDTGRDPASGAVVGLRMGVPAWWPSNDDRRGSAQEVGVGAGGCAAWETERDVGVGLLDRTYTSSSEKPATEGATEGSSCS